MSDSFLKRRADARLRSADDEGDLEGTGETGANDAESTQRRAAPKTPGGWRGLVEQRIQEGLERGMFDNLRGAGKPLNLDEDALVPEDMRMAFRLLRSNGLAPLWVELNKEIRDDVARLERFRAFVHARWEQTNAIQRDHHRREYIGRVHEINGKILNYNILAPSSSVHFATLILDDELTKFDSVAGRQ